MSQGSLFDALPIGRPPVETAPPPPVDVVRLNRGMAMLPRVVRMLGEGGADLCVGCGEGVLTASQYFLAIGAVEASGKATHALVHTACHPPWWRARCEAALAQIS